ASEFARLACGRHARLSSEADALPLSQAGVPLLSPGSSFGDRLLAAVAEVGRMRLHALGDCSLARLDVGAELLGVRLAGLADRRRADDRDLTVLGQVGEMRLHAVLEDSAAFLRLVTALRLDVRPASLGGRGGGECGMGHKQSCAERCDAGQCPRHGCPPITMRASALTSKATPFRGRVYIEHDADRVNDFLVSVGVARTQIWLVQFCARARDFTGLSSFFCNSKTPLHRPVDRSATAK